MDKIELFRCWTILKKLAFEIDEGKYNEWGFKIEYPMITMNYLKKISEELYGE